MRKNHVRILHPVIVLLALFFVTVPFSSAAPVDPIPSYAVIVDCDHPVNPNAHFSLEHIASATIAQTVVFTDESTAPGSQPVTTWRWDFGDGTTSSQKNPRHTYSTYAPGETIWVNLRVTTACGRSDEYNAGFGLRCIAPAASFTTDVTGGAAPLTVHITDTSVNAPESATTWKYTIWQDFTELAQLNQRNPVYTFGTPGRYRIYQNLTKPCSAHSVSVQDIDVLEPAAVTTTVTTTTAPAVTTTEESPAPAPGETGPEPPATLPAPDTTAPLPATTTAPATAPGTYRETAAPAITAPVTPGATATPVPDPGSSTGLIIAGVIVLVIIGAGAYLYMKGKKSA